MTTLIDGRLRVVVDFAELDSDVTFICCLGCSTDLSKNICLVDKMMKAPKVTREIAVCWYIKPAMSVLFKLKAQYPWVWRHLSCLASMYSSLRDTRHSARGSDQHPYYFESNRFFKYTHMYITCTYILYIHKWRQNNVSNKTPGCINSALHGDQDNNFRNTVLVWLGGEGVHKQIAAVRMPSASTLWRHYCNARSRDSPLCLCE